MTVIKCPHGCGGFVNTATDNYCPSCRRDLASVDIVMPNGAKTEEYGESNCMTAHKPADYREDMRVSMIRTNSDKRA